MSEELELMERRKQEAARRKAEQKAQAEEAARKRRRLVKIEIAAFVLSAIGIAFVLYYDTTRIADEFYAVHLRSGQVLDVHDGGRIYRIPILDKVVLIDKGLRPVPALRRNAKAANGATVSYEAVLGFAVVDAQKYWTRFKGADNDVARLVSQAVETASQAALARRDGQQLAAQDAAKTVAVEVIAAANAALAEVGLAVRELRFVGLRVMP